MMMMMMMMMVMMAPYWRASIVRRRRHHTPRGTATYDHAVDTHQHTHQHTHTHTHVNYRFQTVHLIILIPFQLDFNSRVLKFLSAQFEGLQTLRFDWN